MRAITLWQPWASLVAVGVKSIETRSWSTSYRGPLAIHAAQRPPKFEDMKRLVGDEPQAWSVWYGAKLVADDGATDYIPRGGVVATCYLAEIVLTEDLVWGEDVHARAPGWYVEAGSSPVVAEANVNQRPFGDFTAGRYAWLLADIKPLALPWRVRGRQGLWNWEGPCD